MWISGRECSGWGAWQWRSRSLENREAEVKRVREGHKEMRWDAHGTQTGWTPVGHNWDGGFYSELRSGVLWRGVNRLTRRDSDGARWRLVQEAREEMAPALDHRGRGSLWREVVGFWMDFESGANRIGWWIGCGERERERERSWGWLQGFGPEQLEGWSRGYSTAKPGRCRSGLTLRYLLIFLIIKAEHLGEN